MSNTGDVSYKGISFLGLLALLFIALKLTHQINWSWIWVLCPLWIGVAGGILLMIVGGLLWLIGTVLEIIINKIEAKKRIQEKDNHAS